mgnify:CR=1 FL=1
MRDLRSAVASADISGAFPYMFMFLYYEQVREYVSKLVSRRVSKLGS